MSPFTIRYWTISLLLLLQQVHHTHSQQYSRFRDVFPVVPGVNDLLEDDGDDGGDEGTQPPSSGSVVYGLQPSCNSQDLSGFNLCLDLRSSRGEKQPWMDILFEAKSKWEVVITGDLPAVSSADLPVDSDRVCTQYPPVIDDLYICASDAIIDGPGTILGGALPVTGRQLGKTNPNTGLPYLVPLTGLMIFDVADIENLIRERRFFEVLKHEIGHVVGLGSLWVDNGLHQAGSAFYAAGTHAHDEWLSIGCTGRIPVETDGGQGTAGSHWDETCLNHEIMTGFISGVEQPFSRITIGSLEDLGYEVDYSRADPFSTGDLRSCGGVCRGVRNLRVTNMGDKGEPKLPVKRRLTDKDFSNIRQYAKKELSRLRENTGRRGTTAELPEGVVDLGGESMDVFYQDGSGVLHVVGVSWEDAVYEP